EAVAPRGADVEPEPVRVADAPPALIDLPAEHARDEQADRVVEPATVAAAVVDTTEVLGDPMNSFLAEATPEPIIPPKAEPEPAPVRRRSRSRLTSRPQDPRQSTLTGVNDMVAELYRKAREDSGR